jgi:outer membrane beta-barrel protein
MRRFAFFSILMCLSSTALSAPSQIVKFPEEELARESVLPKFKDTKMVLNRNVTTAKRLSAGPDLGFALNEPWNSPFQYGGFLNYHLDESKAINVLLNMVSGSNSSYSDQLTRDPIGTGTNFGLSNRARPKYLVIGSFQYNAFYGKISLTKQFVINLMLYGLLGGGAINFGGDIYPVISVGLGQKFYFTKKLALRLDLRSIMFNGPNVTDPKNPTQYASQNREFAGSEFNNILTMTNVLFGGLEFQF